MVGLIKRVCLSEQCETERVVIFGRRMWGIGEGRVVRRVKVRCKTKISKVLRQPLKHEDRKNSDGRWSTWLKESEREREANIGVSASVGCRLVNSGGVFPISAGESQEPGME